MAVLKTGGRADIAASYKALAEVRHNYMVAFGPGHDWWGSQQSVLLAFGLDDTARIAPAHAPISGLTVRSADGQTIYTLGADYVADPSSGIVTRNIAGRIGAGEIAQVTYTATVPDPDLTTQGLVSEVGRVTVGAVQHVVPFDEAAPGGEFVVVNGARYVLTDQRSRALLFTAHLTPTDGVGAPIREYALYSRCAVDPSLPPGQTYFEPHQIIQPGTLVASRFRTPVPHDGTIGLNVSVVIEI